MEGFGSTEGVVNKLISVSVVSRRVLDSIRRCKLLVLGHLNL